MEAKMTIESPEKKELEGDQTDNPILAAAIAALLIEYKRHVGQRDGQQSPKNDQDNWRMIARWEQLRG